MTSSNPLGVFTGLWQLTWLEIKIFVREPMGVIGTVGVPVAVFALMSRLMGPRSPAAATAAAGATGTLDVPVLAAVLISLSAVLSLVTIISIYREGGILKRLRATPLRPTTILLSQVLVKLLFTLVTLILLALVGQRLLPAGLRVPWVSFAAALLIATAGLQSIGFLIASIVPTARFAQPIASAVLYPMLGVSGLFVPIAALPPALQVLGRVLPLGYAVSLLRGTLHGDALWAHGGDLGALALWCAVCAFLSSRVFRWE